MMPLKDFKALHGMVRQLFREAKGAGMTLTQIAADAGLGLATVSRLANYDTMYPRCQTLLGIAKAVGYEVRLAKSGKQLKLYGRTA